MKQPNIIVLMSGNIMNISFITGPGGRHAYFYAKGLFYIKSLIEIRTWISYCIHSLFPIW